MRMCRPEFLRAVATRVHAYGALLIFDEVLTGFGRTGGLFACLEAGIEPDLICLSKGLTGGFMPMGATVAGDHIYEAFLGDTMKRHSCMAIPSRPTRWDAPPPWHRSICSTAMNANRTSGTSLPSIASAWRPCPRTHCSGTIGFAAPLPRWISAKAPMAVSYRGKSRRFSAIAAS